VRGCLVPVSVLLVAALAGCSTNASRSSRLTQGEAELFLPEFAVSHELKAGEGFRMPELLLPAVQPVVGIDAGIQYGTDGDKRSADLCIEIGIDETGDVVEQTVFASPLYCPDSLAASLERFRAAILAATQRWRFRPAAFCTDAQSMDPEADPCGGTTAIIEPVGVKLAFAFAFRLENGDVRVERQPLVVPP
jgi:hypothetical protein